MNDSGIPNRASTLTGAFRWANGHYTVATKAPVEPGCATVATRGSVNMAVPFNPATIELISPPAGNTKSFDVRELLFFGGNATNQAFHAAIVCP